MLGGRPCQQHSVSQNGTSPPQGRNQGLFAVLTPFFALINGPTPVGCSSNPLNSLLYFCFSKWSLSLEQWWLQHSILQNPTDVTP